MNTPINSPAITQEEQSRADMYDFLGALLFAPPDRSLLTKIAGLQGDETELGAAIKTLAHLAREQSAAVVEREYHTLFIGVGRGELLPYASYYLTGFLHEKPLARLRTDMRNAGLMRAEKVHEPEDHIASLMELMAALITGRFDRPAHLDQQREMFQTHIAPWAGYFFADLETARGSVFYAPVGTLGRVFMTIEDEAFRLVEPAAKTG